MQNKSSREIPVRVYRHEDEVEFWKDEYLEVKQLISREMGAEAGLEGAHSKMQPSYADRRAEPRYSFMPGSKIYAHMGPRGFPIVDISIGGLSFYSELLFEPGSKLLMSALGMIALDVEVLSCDMEETDSSLMEYKYRVRAKFGPHVNGYQVYVLAREMHLQETKDQNARKPMDAGLLNAEHKV